MMNKTDNEHKHTADARLAYHRGYARGWKAGVEHARGEIPPKQRNLAPAVAWLLVLAVGLLALVARWAA